MSPWKSDNPQDFVKPAAFDGENPVDIYPSDEHEKDVASPPAGHQLDPVHDTDQVQGGMDEDNVDPDFVLHADCGGTTDPQPSSESQPVADQQRKSTRTRRPPG